MTFNRGWPTFPAPEALSLQIFYIGRRDDSIPSRSDISSGVRICQLPSLTFKYVSAAPKLHHHHQASLWLRVVVFPGCDTHRRLLEHDLGTGGGGGDLPILILRRHGAGETCAGHLQLVQRVSLNRDKNEAWRILCFLFDWARSVGKRDFRLKQLFKITSEPV